MGQTAVSDKQSSSVTLNELANKARKNYCNFEFQRRSHTMTETDLNLTFLQEICIVGQNTLIHCSQITIARVDVNIFV